MKLKITAMLGLLLVSLAAAEIKHSYSFVCHNERCKSYKAVFTFEETTPHEHKCPTCQHPLDQVK